MKALVNAIAICGSQTALAAALKVAPQVVNNWIRRESVPAERCPDIERVTGGAVTCEALRPDVDWGYLRRTTKADETEAVVMVVAEAVPATEHAYPEPVHDDRRDDERRNGDRRVRGEQRTADRRHDDRRDGVA